MVALWSRYGVMFLGLSDLNATEQLVLVGLAKAIVQADKQVSAEEAAAIKDLATQMGAASWNARVGEARTKLRTAQDLFDLARSIHGLDARETIHTALKSLAESDTLMDEEAAILEWVAEVWQLGGAAGDEEVDEDVEDPDTFDDEFVLHDEDAGS
jgi:hypothetical protein